MPPTEKQYNFAKKIAETLNVEMPQVFTKKAYYEWTDHYINQYKREMQRYWDEDEEEEY